jgi:DNA-directed RNA polymerase subunit RPC12/RpoP
MESCYEEKETKDCTEIIEENQKINESKVIIKEKEENFYNNSVNSTSTISTTNTVISINTNNPINTIETNNSFNSNIIKNLASITCPNCNFDILYNKIKEDIINGVNIKCSNCSQYFYSSKCPKCKEYFKIDEFIHEGELITCQKCNNQYLQTSCIIKNCEEHFYFVKPKNYTNLPNGIIHDHKKQLV